MHLPRTLIVVDEAFVEVAGRPHSPYHWWRFARELARHCESATLYVPLKQADDPGDAHPADVQPLRLVGRDYYVRMHEFYAGLPRWWRRFRRQAAELVAEHDLVIGRMPGPASRWVAAAAHRQRKPMALFVAGDVLAGSAWEPKGSLPKRIISTALARLVRGQEDWVARRAAFVGVWDTQMQPRFERLCRSVAACQSPNLCAAQLTWREDCCRQRPVRLLRVCRLSPVKNVELLLDALARLVADGRDVTLDVVGGIGIPSYYEQLQRRIGELRLDSRVTFGGALAFGEELFARYRAADIHVVSSRWEGLPRCLAEGRAFCLPTVATAVGGIPSVIKDGEDGLLTPADDPAAMAAAIARVIDDGDLRRRIIRNGFERAKESTAEFHAERIARLIAAALAN